MGLFGNRLGTKPAHFSHCAAVPHRHTLQTASRPSLKTRASKQFGVDVATKSLDELQKLELDTLREALELSVLSEDYATAAKVRDAIRTVEQRDPLVSLQSELEVAILEERYVSNINHNLGISRSQATSLAPPFPHLSSYFIHYRVMLRYYVINSKNFSLLLLSLPQLLQLASPKASGSLCKRFTLLASPGPKPTTTCSPTRSKSPTKPTLLQLNWSLGGGLLQMATGGSGKL